MLTSRQAERAASHESDANLAAPPPKRQRRADAQQTFKLGRTLHSVFNFDAFDVNEYPILEHGIFLWETMTKKDGIALLNRIKECARKNPSCEMPTRIDNNVTLTALQVCQALCHAILCNATDPVGAELWSPKAKKPSNRSASQDYQSDGGLVMDDFLKCDIRDHSGWSNAAQKVTALLCYFDVATAEGYDNDRKISFTAHSAKEIPRGDSTTQFPAMTLHTSDMTNDTVQVDSKNATCVNFANFVFGFGKMSKSLNGVSQEEALQVKYPELLLGMAYFGQLDETECIVATGMRQFAEGMYESEGISTWKCTGPVTLTKELEILSMDAFCYDKHIKRDKNDPERRKFYNEQFSINNVKRDLLKAFACFEVKSGGHVATGLWGCGQFKGNPYLKFLQQYLAAAHAKLRSMSFSCYNKELLKVTCENLLRGMTDCNVEPSDLQAFLLNLDSKLSSDMQETPEHVFLQWVCQWLEAKKENEKLCESAALNALKSDASEV